MLKRVITKSLLNRKRQLTIAATSILVAATLIAALATLSLGMKTQVSHELEAYGANIVLVPKTVSLPSGTGQFNFGQITTDSFIAEQDLNLLDTGVFESIKIYVPYLYNIANYQGQKVVVAGTLFDSLKKLDSYWQVEGNWPGNEDVKAAIIGKNVAQQFVLQAGDEFSLNFGTQTQSFTVAGIAGVGGSEDNQIFIDLKTAQSLSSRSGQIDLVQIRASAEKQPLTEVSAGLATSIPSVEAKVVGQIAGAEEAILFKIELLIALIAILVLIGSAVAVFSTLTASVLERIKEIGLMKALGASNSRIALIFLAEAWTIGLAGGLLGNILGWGLAQTISKSVFNVYLPLQAWTIPITLAVALAVTTASALGPVRNATAVEPITILRGE